jgi:hypothetical protein
VRDIAVAELTNQEATGRNVFVSRDRRCRLPRSVEHPWPSNRSNIDATLSVLMTARKNDVKTEPIAASLLGYRPRVSFEEGLARRSYPRNLLLKSDFGLASCSLPS